MAEPYRAVRAPMSLTFPENARWNAEQRAVEFRVEDRRVPRRGPGLAARVPKPAAGAAHTERCIATGLHVTLRRVHPAER